MINWSDLVNKMKAKDPVALAQFIDQTQKELFQFCLYLTHNRQFAEDILHDTYLKGFDSLASLKNPNSILGWLKQIARFLYFDYLKSAAFRNEIHDDYDIGFAAEQSVDENNARLDVFKILQKLEEADRTLLLVIDIQGCSYQEAALILDVPLGTVKSRLNRAREKFSDFYDGTKLGT